MIGFLGYNFFADGNAADPMPVYNFKANSLSAGGFVIKQIRLSKNTEFEETVNISDIWDKDTLLLTHFDKKTLQAGYFPDAFSRAYKARIKRREVGTGNWFTIKEFDLRNKNTVITFDDYSAVKSNVTYEYAIVPMDTDTTEGQYFTRRILSQYKGVFICTVDTAFKMYAQVSYGDTQQNQKVDIYEPLNKKYPTLISNATTNYKTGSLAGMILQDNYDEEERVPDRKAIVDKANSFLEFVTDKQPKVIKDWNGNAFLVVFTDAPSLSYDSNYGMGVINASADWVEVGSVDSRDDLYYANLIPSKE